MTRLLDRSKHLTLQPPLACSQIWWCHDTVVGPLKAPYTSTPPSLVVKYGDVMTRLLDRSKHLTLHPPSLVVKYGDVMTRWHVGPLKAPYTSNPLACSEIWWCHDTVVGPLKAPYTSTPLSLVVKYGDVMTQLLDHSKHLTLQTPLACSEIWWCHDTVVGPLKAPYTSSPPSLVVKYGDVMTQLLDRSKHLTLQPPSLVVKYGDVMTQLLDRSKHLTLHPPSLVVKYGDVMTRLLDRSKHLTLHPPRL